MLASLTLDDASGSPVTLHETSKRFLTGASGLAGISPVRAVTRVRPTQHGGIDESRWTDASTIVLEGECFSTIAGDAISDAYTEFLAVARPMLETLTTPAAMKWQVGTTGLLLQKLVKLTSDVDPHLIAGEASYAYQAQFRASDPRAYSQTLKTIVGPVLTTGGGAIMPRTFPVTFDQSAGGTFAVVNAGNRPTPPILRIYGDCTNPQIVLVGSGKRIALTGRINPGDYLELDAQARTIKLNGTSSSLRYLDPVNTTWFELPVGTSTLQMIAGSFDTVAHATAIFRDAYT